MADTAPPALDGLPASAWRPAWAEVDLDVIGANVAFLVERCAPAAVCAVVKADGYGHGAAAVARAALGAGATWLAVALVEEGVALRDEGIDAPVLLLSEPPPGAMGAVVAARLTPTLYSHAGVSAAAAAAEAGGAPVAVHLKVDTGMHRVGADPALVAGLAASVRSEDALVLQGLWTHLAVADEPDGDTYTQGQLARFEAVRGELAGAGVVPHLLHAANSAAALALPAARYDLVRCGIAMYGHPPRAGCTGPDDLRPALSLRARVSMVRTLEAGERLSYGRRHAVPARSVVATVPLGYADGVTRRLGEVGAEVLVGGRRRPVAGTVTMDQLMVDCGPDAPVVPGDEVVLLGRQGGEEIRAEEWAGRLGTITYEVLCGIGPRVPRVVVGSRP